MLEDKLDEYLNTVTTVELTEEEEEDRSYYQYGYF